MRRILGLLLASFIALSLLAAPPAGAGTADDPEVTDPAGDADDTLAVAVFGAAGDRDLVKVWLNDTLVSTGKGPAIRFNIETAGDFDHLGNLNAFHERIRVAFTPTAGLADGAVEAYLALRPSFAEAPSTEEYLTCRFGVASAAGGSQSLSQELVLDSFGFDTNLFYCDLPLSLLAGFDAAQNKVTQTYANFQMVTRGPLAGDPPGGGDYIPVTVVQDYDRAPDADFGREWSAAAAPQGPGNLNDTDNDSLNDTWEQANFGDLNQTADGDPDADGQTNQQEFFAGTDPNDADSDDDGFTDDEEAEAGTDPNDPSSNITGGPPTTTTTTTTTSPTTTGTGTTTSPTTTTTGTTAGGDSVADKLSDQAGYLAASGGAMAAVAILGLIGIFGRWGL